MRFLILLFLFGCSGVQKTEPAKDSEHCASACANLRYLGCEEGEDIIDSCSSVNCTNTCDSGSCNISCEQFCLATQNAGVWLDPICVSMILSCDVIDTCQGK